MLAYEDEAPVAIEHPRIHRLSPLAGVDTDEVVTQISKAVEARDPEAAHELLATLFPSMDGFKEAGLELDAACRGER